MHCFLIMLDLNIPTVLRDVPHNCSFTMPSKSFNGVPCLIIFEIPILNLKVVVRNYFKAYLGSIIFSIMVHPLAIYISTGRTHVVSRYVAIILVFIGARRLIRSILIADTQSWSCPILVTVSVCLTGPSWHVISML